MLVPREADLPALFLFLVVFPLVTYILLGKWSETSKKKERIGLLAQLAAEESFREEAMAAASVFSPPVAPPSVVPPPVAPPPKALLHECARCRAPATTRCSRCKSVRYCSGKCQIIHWRNIHKDECQPIEFVNASSRHVSSEESDHEHLRGQSVASIPEQPVHETTLSHGKDYTPLNHGTPTTSGSSTMNSSMPKPGRKSTEKRVSRKPSREVLGREGVPTSFSTENSCVGRASSKETRTKGNDSIYLQDDLLESLDLSSNESSRGLNTASREKPNVGSKDDSGQSGSFYKEGDEAQEKKSLSSILPNDGSCRSKSTHKPVVKTLKESVENVKERKEQVCKEPVAAVGNAHCAEGGIGVTNQGFMKMMGLKKSAKTSRKDASVVLFPYEEFVKFFQCEILDLTPRGLFNCGNSCYANAVLQCLTCTKPLVVYLLKRIHSRSCCVKSWCLMCELEKHVQILRESGGPLSPSRILSHMRSMNCPMGDGSQEDAHEFLRLLVASMQSTCLEEFGGEKRVHPLLQETTFVQHTFGGRLRSRVECLKCGHQSERCENIMDLTLEIFGWVESLEDALTQFTSPEDLDGENMYKCGRCTSYVRARKQLSIDEAPNILTIVLKRFQEGSYGKINKCITFPEMLDMIPFMTGTYDVPPLYMLYGVVVHMDTLNASFSGHYVSYVKDLQGNWLRIDDSDVQLVPLSQVMSEGAYILFYMRSYPRPLHGIRQQNHSSSKAHKSMRSKPGLSELSSVVYNSHATNDILRNANNHKRFSMSSPLLENYVNRPKAMDFSDAASSSDWSLFTSSDEAASFTTESTRDSFSTTADYAEVILDSVSSFFNPCTQDHASQRTVSCRMFSGSMPLTRVHEEVTGYVVDSCYYDPMYMNPSTVVWPDGSCLRTGEMAGGEYVNNPSDFVAYGGSDDNCSLYGHSRTNYRY